MIVILSLVAAAVVIEYGLYLSWRDTVRLLKEEGEKSVFEFLGMLNGEEGLSR